MSRRLTQNLNSAYIEAMNRLKGKNARRRIVAYVESYDDVFFWSNLLRPLETEQYYFEVMLPSRTSLQKGKKTVLANSLGERLGNYMIACVDADYDYLMQGATPTSRYILQSPYVFHTYAYAIENLQCYAPALRQVCASATLNDKRLFDFEKFFEEFSTIIWPLFVWNVWCYRYDHYKTFSMLDFYHIIEIQKLDFYHPEKSLEALRHRVNAKIARLQKSFPEGKKTYKPLWHELETLGLTPAKTYLYMRGHDLLDGIVTPILQTICEALRREREREIRNLAVHATQKQNELSSYQHSVQSVETVLRRHTDYIGCQEYRHIQADVRKFLKRNLRRHPNQNPTQAEPPLTPPLGE